MPRLIRTEHRNLTPAEILFLIVLDEHQGRDPLKLRQIERRMIPYPAAEMFLASKEYIEQGKLPNGKPVSGSWVITEEGQRALRSNFASAIAQAESALAAAKADARTTPEEIGAAESLVQRLREKRSAYPALPGDGEADESKSGGEADNWNEWEDDRNKGEREDTATDPAARQPAPTNSPRRRNKHEADRGGQPKPSIPKRSQPVSKTGRPKPRRAAEPVTTGDDGDDESNT